PFARDAAHREPPAAARPRLRAGARRRPDYHGRRRRGAAAARSGRVRVRRDRSQAFAHDHRQVRRRSGRPQQHRRGHQPGKRRYRSTLRTVPDPDRILGSDAARARRHAARLRLPGAGCTREELDTVVTPAQGKAPRPAPGAARGARCAHGRTTTITSLATYVPPRVLTNADLEQIVDTNDEWIVQRTGIRERHIVEPGVGASDLGKEAAVAGSARAGLTPDGIRGLGART